MGFEALSGIKEVCSLDHQTLLSAHSNRLMGRERSGDSRNHPKPGSPQARMETQSENFGTALHSFGAPSMRCAFL